MPKEHIWAPCLVSMLLILIFFVFLAAVSFVWASYSAAPWVPTFKSDVERFLRLADIKPGDRVYDLGCGDGRLVAAASAAGARATGFEISLFPFLLAKARGIFLERRGQYEVRFKDFWRADLSGADVVYFFLMPKVYPKLKAKLERELRARTRVIAYVWPIKGWQPVAVDKHRRRPDIYCYRV